MAAMVSSGDVTAYRTLSVVQFPPAPPAFDPQADRLDRNRIAGLFPLIRSVRVDVQVPGPIATRLGLDRIPRFELVDCPGLGADRSSLRDAYLCMRELKNIETIVIVVDSADPGADAPTRIYDLMHDAWEGYIKDRILAVANKFDALFDKDSSDLDELRKLAAAEGNFTEGDVRGTFGETLDEIIVSTRNVVERGRDDRIAPVSALQGLHWLGEEPAYGGGGLTVYTPEFRARHLTPEQVTRWDELSDLWQGCRRQARHDAPGRRAPGLVAARFRGRAWRRHRPVPRRGAASTSPSTACRTCASSRGPVPQGEEGRR